MKNIARFPRPLPEFLSHWRGTVIGVIRKKHKNGTQRNRKPKKQMKVVERAGN
jgi:hypothetical protein